jgi:hypothetical protein
MTTSISPVSQAHVHSQPKPVNQNPQAQKPREAQPATSGADKVTLRSTQDSNQGGDHG